MTGKMVGRSMKSFCWMLAGLIDCILEYTYAALKVGRHKNRIGAMPNSCVGTYPMQTTLDIPKMRAATIQTSGSRDLLLSNLHGF